jgi:hypothetical protein
LVKVNNQLNFVVYFISAESPKKKRILLKQERNGVLAISSFLAVKEDAGGQHHGARDQGVARTQSSGSSI